MENKSSTSVNNSLNDKKQLRVEHIETSSLDSDAQKLLDLGYKQEYKRETSLFVQSAFSFSAMAVLPNWMVGFGPSIYAGGPSSLFWGWVVVVPFICCIALSMSEVISAYPLEGGAFSWALNLSNKKWGPFMSYISGYVYLTASITGTMTLAYTTSDFIRYTANILNDSQITSQGASVGLYCAVCVAGTLYSLLGMRYSGYLNMFLVFWVGIGTIIIICTVPAMAPTHNTAKWVFTEFLNETGYESMALVFFVGMTQAGWTFVGFECGAQIVEGTKRADVTAPRGILICVGSAIFQTLAIILVTLFSIQDVNELMEADVPLTIFFLRATNSPKITVFFMVILLVAQFGSLCNCTLASAHFIHALARDKCLPFSKHLSKLSGRNRIPLVAMATQLIIFILVIMPAFGSEIYWQAVMSASVICCNVSYGIPLLCKLIWVGNNMPKGPFNLGKFSIPLNLISVIWVSFFSVVLCIPTVSPVTPATMNWASLIIGGVMIFSLFFWYISGRHNYKVAEPRSNDSNNNN